MYAGTATAMAWKAVPSQCIVYAAASTLVASKIYMELLGPTPTQMIHPLCSLRECPSD